MILTDVDTTGLATGDSLVYDGSNFVAQRPTNIEDADGDTRVHVEESPDEDKVRIDTGGTERMIIDKMPQCQQMVVSSYIEQHLLQEKVLQ